MLKTFSILTFGCAMNYSDTERVRAVCCSLGLKEERNFHLADMVIFNSCSVRQKGEDRVFGLIGDLRSHQKKDAEPKVIVLTGCMVRKEKKKDFSSLIRERIDIFLNIKEIGNLGKKLLGLKKISKIGKDYQANLDNYFQINPQMTENYRALVPIMTGCNNFCTYCIVPYARGREVSRTVNELLIEIKKFDQNGAKEIVLLGQNVNSYAPCDEFNFSIENPYTQPFAKLLWEVNNSLKNIKRISFLTSHPKDLHNDLIDALSLDKMINNLHLPIQSGDNKVLEAMNRHYTVEHYLDLIKKVRVKKPNIVIGTDVIVGFPGETRKQFNKTVRLYKKADLDVVYISKYSQRSGTKAAELEDNVSDKEKKRRWNILNDVMGERNEAKNKTYEGRILEVLVDNFNANKGMVSGQSRELKKVIFRGEVGDVGQIRQVKIVEGKMWVLKGERVSE